MTRPWVALALWSPCSFVEARVRLRDLTTCFNQIISPIFKQRSPLSFVHGLELVSHWTKNACFCPLEYGSVLVGSVESGEGCCGLFEVSLGGGVFRLARGSAAFFPAALKLQRPGTGQRRTEGVYRHKRTAVSYVLYAICCC